MKIHLDFETRSIIDLRKTGLHIYAAHPSTEVTCLAYAIGDEPTVHGWRLGNPPPIHLFWLIEQGVEVHAWNAQFERTIWSTVCRRSGWVESNKGLAWPGERYEQWHCSMANGGLHALPLGLEKAANAIGIEQGKDMVGGTLMRQMCRPRAYGAGGVPVWWEDEDRLERLLAYCKQDVIVEREISRRLYPMPELERRLYIHDQRVNDRGVLLDTKLAGQSLKLAAVASAKADKELDDITGGQVVGVTKVKALTEWVRRQGVEVESLSKAAISALQAGDIPQDVSDALQVRVEAGKSSVAKLSSMLAYAGADGRMRGLMQFSGAGTGRWAGRGPQPHNFPRGSVANVEQFIPTIMAGRIDILELIAPVMEILSSLLRAHMKAAPGRRLVVGDFASIEARVLAWLAGEEHLLRLFRTGGDTYKAMAARIYQVAVEQVTKLQRQMGKVAILGLGYQMGPLTFVQSCWDQVRIRIGGEFAGDVVKVYRSTNPAICALWRDLDNAAIDAVLGTGDGVAAGGRVTFVREGYWLRMCMPSGRSLYYANPRVFVVDTPWVYKKATVVVDHWNGTIKRWHSRKMYGGLWTENIVQALSRDILAAAMLRVEEAGYPVIMTVHDEIVTEPEGPATGSTEHFEKLMSTVPAWAKGCPISVEAWEGERYRK